MASVAPPKNDEERAMLPMIDDAPLRRRCAEAAVETAQRCTIEAIGPHWEALLRTLSQKDTPQRSALCQAQ